MTDAELLSVTIILVSIALVLLGATYRRRPAPVDLNLLVKSVFDTLEADAKHRGNSQDLHKARWARQAYRTACLRGVR